MQPASPQHRSRRRHHSLALAFVASAFVGALIGMGDVLYMESPAPSVLALAIAAFGITWVVPSRWLAVATTLTFIVWIAHLAVRAPWWPHPDEKQPHDWTGVLAALPSVGGAMSAAFIQMLRKRY